MNNKRTQEDIAKQRTSDLIVGLTSKINSATLSAAQVNAACDTALTDYDAPTRAEATADKDAIITEVNANETKIDAVKGDTAAILLDTAVIGALGAGLTAIPWNSDWDTEVQSECADALTTYDAPTKAEMDAGHALLATPAQVATALTDYDAPTKAELDTTESNIRGADSDTLKTLSDQIDGIGGGGGGDATEAKQDIIIADISAAVPDTPTAKSLQDILSKADGSNTFDNTTDSLEAISEYIRFKKAFTITATTSASYVNMMNLSTVGELIAVSIESRNAGADQIFCTINVDGAGAQNVGCNDAAQNTSYWLRHGTTREAGINSNYYELETSYHGLHICFNTSLVIQMRDPVAATGGTAVIYAIYNIKT